MAIVDLRDVHRSFGSGATQVPVLRGITFRIEPKEMVAIVGPSGSGKSTLMNIVGLLDRPTRGLVRIAGHDVSHLSGDAMARLRGHAVGFVFQSYNLLARYTALENVELPMVYEGIGRKERKERALRALKAVGLADRSRHRPNQLSGGEQQRVAIARALVRDPLLLLADEPTGALDSRTGAQVLSLFHDLHAAGLTIMMITHDPRVARECGRVLAIRDGRLERGTT